MAEVNLIFGLEKSFQTPDGKEFYKGIINDVLVILQKEIKFPCVFREKTGKDGRNYYVFRNPVNNELGDYVFLEIFSGGKQDHRYDYGWYKIKEETSQGYKILVNSYQSWGDQHTTLVAMRIDGKVVIEGNDGAGFKSKYPVPDFFRVVEWDEKEKKLKITETTDLDIL